MRYYGQLEIEGNFFQFILEEYKLSISNYEKVSINNKMIDRIIDNNWINLQDNEGNFLFIKIDEIFNKSLYERKFDVAGYIVKYNRGKKRTDNVIRCTELFFKSDILDYFFKTDGCYQKEAIYLLNEWITGSNLAEKPKGRRTYDIDIEDNEYKIQFKTTIQGSNAPFPFDIRNNLIVSSKSLSEKDNIWKIVKTVSLFLKFISQSPNVDFLNPIIVNTGVDINETDTYLYIRPDTGTKIIRQRVLDYKDLETVLGRLLELIYNEDINFRSLLISNYEKITYADIMNICAAFESQFERKCEGVFHYDEQKRVRRKMVKVLKKLRDEEFTKEEVPLFDEIIDGFNKYSDTLKKRIELALEEFVEVYGEDIEFDFEKDYRNMPDRIKNTRNALDHGNHQYKLQRIMYWDSELLRAIVYMLIFKTIGIDDKDTLKRMLKKLSLF